MSNSIPPNENFNGIFYNPLFFDNSTSITEAYGSENYLSRVGVANSVANITTFGGLINATDGLSVLGGETTDTINATNYILVNGVNINSIYQTISGMYIYQLKGNYVLNQDIYQFLTISNALLNYQPTGNYVYNNDINTYLSISSSIVLYQPLVLMYSIRILINIFLYPLE